MDVMLQAHSISETDNSLRYRNTSNTTKQDVFGTHDVHSRDILGNRIKVREWLSAMSS